jgi:hypothetical protein
MTAPDEADKAEVLALYRTHRKSGFRPHTAMGIVADSYPDGDARRAYAIELDAIVASRAGIFINPAPTVRMRYWRTGRVA